MLRGLRMELGAFCARAPVQRQLRLFLLEATCWQCRLWPPAVLAHVAVVWTWPSLAWVQGCSGSFLCAWAGRGSPGCAVPPELWGSFPVSGVEVRAWSAGRCGLSSQVCVAEQGQLSFWVSPESQELQSEWW